jgi:flagellin
MDINTSTINSSALQSASSLERISSAVAINQSSDDASGLSIADALGSQQYSLSQSIENMNNGIAMSNIAQSGIAAQKDILEEINTLTLQSLSGTTSPEGIETIASQINKFVEQFDTIANSTNYNGQSLLQTSGDASDDLTIQDTSSTIEMQKADTKSVSDSLKSFLSDFTTSRDSREGLLDALGNAQNQLASFTSGFSSSANAMESNARNALAAATNTAAARSSILDVDYGSEISDFSKSNILNQIGTIMQSQANAIQTRNISLLT